MAEVLPNVAIVREKSTDNYRTFGVERPPTPAETWTTGNSPRSDIRPVLEAECSALFVRHLMT